MVSKVKPYDETVTNGENLDKCLTFKTQHLSLSYYSLVKVYRRIPFLQSGL